MTAKDRINDLAVETTQTLLDSAYLAQKQNAQLVNSWLSVLEANHKETRNLVAQLMRQTQEAQSLWVRYTQDAFRTNVETFTRTTQAQMKEFSENLETAAHQANSAAARVQPAAK